MKSTLRIFIAENCPGCNDAREIAAQIEQNYPKIAVELVDIVESRAAIPESIFATPTYMLNDRVVSLGNPSPEQVAQWVEEAAAIQAEP
jgi:glutaredoxin-related protein